MAAVSVGGPRSGAPGPQGHHIIGLQLQQTGHVPVHVGLAAQARHSPLQLVPAKGAEYVQSRPVRVGLYGGGVRTVHAPNQLHRLRRYVQHFLRPRQGIGLAGQGVGELLRGINGRGLLLAGDLHNGGGFIAGGQLPFQVH